MPSSLSRLADNFAEEFHKDKITKSDLEYLTIKDGSLIFNCVSCSKNFEKKFDENLAKRFENTYKFCG